MIAQQSVARSDVGLTMLSLAVGWRMPEAARVLELIWIVGRTHPQWTEANRVLISRHDETFAMMLPMSQVKAAR